MIIFIVDAEFAITMSRNIVFVYLDSVRKDYFDVYASRLSAMADTTFEQCRAPSGWSLPSHASLLTGTLPHKHGISPKVNQTFEALAPDDTFLAQLPDHHKIGVSGNTFASHAFGFDRYFDDFISYSDSKLFQRGSVHGNVIDPAIDSPVRRYPAFLRNSLKEPAPLRTVGNGLFSKVDSEMVRRRISKLPRFDMTGGDAERLSRIMLRMIKEAKEPFFGFVNYMDAHSPFSPESNLTEGPHDDVPSDWHSDALSGYARATPEPFNEDTETDMKYYRHLYTNSIDYLDQTVSTFVKDLQALTTRETTVIVTADHGEDLGYSDENYMIGHSSLSEAIAHVPLVVINSPQSSPERITEYFTQLDVGNLLVEFANNRPVPDSVGCDRIVAESLRVGGIEKSADENIPHLNRAVRSAWEEETRIVWDSLGTCKEYTIDQSVPSKQEFVETRDSYPPTEQELFSRPIKSFDHAETESIDVSDATEDRLRELGYL